MRLEAFRKDENLIAAWKEVLAMEITQIVLRMIADEHPINQPVVSDNHGDLSPTRAGVELGCGRGYSMCAQKLIIAGQSRPLGEGELMPESTYDPEENVPQIKQPTKKKKR